MKFEFGQKFKFKDISDVLVEIDGIYSKSYGVRLDTTSEDHYRIVIKDKKFILPESTIDVLFELLSEKTELEKEFEHFSHGNAIPEPDHVAKLINQTVVFEDSETGEKVALEVEPLPELPEPEALPKKRGRPKIKD